MAGRRTGSSGCSLTAPRGPRPPARLALRRPRRRLLGLPRNIGLEDADGDRLDLRVEAMVTLWHPAENPELQQPWQHRATQIALIQPVDQIDRDVIIATSRTSTSRRAPWSASL